MGKQYICGHCGLKGHNRRTCPSLVSTPRNPAKPKRILPETSENKTYCTRCKSKGYTYFNDHTKASCPYVRKVTCSFCGKKGHTFPKCPDLPAAASKFNEASRIFCENLNNLLNNKGILPGSLVTYIERSENFRYFSSGLRPLFKKYNIGPYDIANVCDYSAVHYTVSSTFLVMSVSAFESRVPFAGQALVDGIYSSIRPFDIKLMPIGATLEISESFRELLKNRFNLSSEQVTALESELHVLAASNPEFFVANGSDPYYLFRVKSSSALAFEVENYNRNGGQQQPTREFVSTRAIEKRMNVIEYNESQSFEALVAAVKRTNTGTALRRTLQRIRGRIENWDF